METVMLAEELLFEMPKSINAVEFGLDDVRVNGRVAHSFAVDGEKLDSESDAAYYKLGNRIALVDRVPRFPRRVVYYLQWKEVFHEFVGHRAITQVAVWRNRDVLATRGVAARMFWEYLFPIHGVMLTDALQTADGRAFWLNRIGEALERNLSVCYLNLMPALGTGKRELVKIEGVKEFERLAAEKEFWGKEELHRARKLIISDIELV
jgi:hypothetical protein